MDITGLPGHAAARLRSAYLRAVSGGNAARRAPEVILALVAQQGFLDPAPGLARQVTLSWAKRVAMDHSLVEWVAQAWTREVEQPSLPGKPRGPIALIVTQLRKLGWEPTEPAMWHQAAGPKNVFDLEGLRSHLDRALSLSRWEGLAGRRRDFAGAEDAIDEEASFREPLKALQDKRNTVIGRYACVEKDQSKALLALTNRRILPKVVFSIRLNIYSGNGNLRNMMRTIFLWQRTVEPLEKCQSATQYTYNRLVNYNPSENVCHHWPTDRQTTVHKLRARQMQTIYTSALK